MSFFVSDSLKNRVTEESLVGISFQLVTDSASYPLQELDIKMNEVSLRCSLFDAKQLMDKNCTINYVDMIIKVDKLKLLKLTKHDDTYQCKFLFYEVADV